MVKKKNPWEKISTKSAYQTPYFRVREDTVVGPNGKEGTYYVVEFNPSVIIVPVSREEKIYLISIFRYPTGIFSWELPGGGVETEDYLSNAKRELKEETGLHSTDWKALGKLQVFNGQSDEWMNVFLALDVKEGKNTMAEEEGIQKLQAFSWSELFLMIKNGEITDAQTIAVLTFTAAKLGKI